MSPAPSIPFRPLSGRPHSWEDASSLTVPSLCSLTEWTPPAVLGDRAEGIHCIQQREVSLLPGSTGQSPFKGQMVSLGDRAPGCHEASHDAGREPAGRPHYSNPASAVWPKQGSNFTSLGLGGLHVKWGDHSRTDGTQEAGMEGQATRLSSGAKSPGIKSWVCCCQSDLGQVT